jgi:2-hydroxychromene-2-carboxylate isomerase
MSKPVIDFIFDFGSPNGYLMLRPLEAVAAKHGTSVRLIPCLLGGIMKATGNQPPFVAFGGVKGKLDYERLEMQRHIQKYGFSKFKMNPHFPVNTLLIMRGMVAAGVLGQQRAYVDAVLAGMWEDGQKMDDPEVVKAVLDKAGLDGGAILAKTQEADVKAALVANTDAAVARGAFGIPTVYVGDQMFFGKERLYQIDELLSTLG